MARLTIRARGESCQFATLFVSFSILARMIALGFWLSMVVAGTGSRLSLTSFIMLYQALWSFTPMISRGIIPSSIGATC